MERLSRLSSRHSDVALLSLLLLSPPNGSKISPSSKYALKYIRLLFMLMFNFNQYVKYLITLFQVG